MKKIAATKIIKNAGQLITVNAPGPIGPRSGKAMSDLGIINKGAVAFASSRIIAVGETKKVMRDVAITKRTKVIDAAGQLVAPGLVDCHSHPVWAGNRSNEFEMRLQGKSYLDIAKEGGGIKATVKATRKASANTLFKNGMKALTEMLKNGATTIEGKSGYGLTLKDEIKMLKVLQRLNKEHDVDVVPTFLGAHEIPDEYKGNPDKYLGLVCGEMIPAVVEAKLAEFCDVFCEKGVFNLKQTRMVLQTAQAFGMKLKIHADQLTSIGGAELAAEFGAISADHLDCISNEGILLIKKAGVIPVLLPGSVFILGVKKKAPARKLINEGLPVALGTDLNPGSSSIHSMPITMSLACIEFKMTPAEVWCAATLNAAFAINRGNIVGSLAPGKKADVVIWEAEDYRDIPYWFGKNSVARIFKNGHDLEL
ncbi:MAG: imidazolonepropionase [candidate division Zixibacteria bacterium]|nr:imidazolonepropionase [candidate division Zixibacteria bacterium]